MLQNCRKRTKDQKFHMKTMWSNRVFMKFFLFEHFVCRNLYCLTCSVWCPCSCCIWWSITSRRVKTASACSCCIWWSFVRLLSVSRIGQAWRPLCNVSESGHKDRQSWEAQRDRLDEGMCSVVTCTGSSPTASLLRPLWVRQNCSAGCCSGGDAGLLFLLPLSVCAQQEPPCLRLSRKKPRTDSHQKHPVLIHWSLRT